MTVVIARARPQLGPDLARQTLWRLVMSDANVDGHQLVAGCPVMVLAVRAYYRDSIGKPGRNDFGVWDDAALLVDLVSGEVRPFNSNTDPSAVGHNAKNGGKLYAQLVAGVWPFRRGPHKGIPDHFRQLTASEAVDFDLERFFTDRRARGEFAVRRLADADHGKVEWGYQAINLHEGSPRGTSSWGCQTWPPDQWIEFQRAAYAMMDARQQRVLPYVLTEERLG